MHLQADGRRGIDGIAGVNRGAADAETALGVRMSKMPHTAGETWKRGAEVIKHGPGGEALECMIRIFVEDAHNLRGKRGRPRADIKHNRSNAL